MKWENLSNEAKAVIEWVESPLTNRKENRMRKDVELH